jgi:hypothetical protein
MDFSFDEPEFLDPADWNLASYLHHPVDDLEPLPDHSTSYRDAALECMKILRSVDAFMSRPQIRGSLGLLFHARSN